MNTSQLQRRRAEVIRLHLEKTPVMQISAMAGLGWAAVTRAIRAYETGGETALVPAKAGRHEGQGRAITPELEARFRQLLLTQRPDKDNRKRRLWSRSLVAELMRAEPDVTLTDKAVGNYLKRWGLMVAGPNKAPAQRCSPVIRKWLLEHYSLLKAQAQVTDAEVYWLQSPVTLDLQLWLPTSTGSANGRRALSRLSFASAVNNQGKLLWKFFRGPFDIKRQQIFVDALIRDTQRRTLFMIRKDERHYEVGDLQQRVAGHVAFVLPDAWGEIADAEAYTLRAAATQS